MDILLGINIARRVMSLPMGPDLTEAEQERIIAALLDVY